MLWYVSLLHSGLFFFFFKSFGLAMWHESERGFSRDADGKESAHNAGDLGSFPESGRSPGEGNGYPLQYSCLKNSMDRGAWRATVHGVTKSQT